MYVPSYFIDSAYIYAYCSLYVYKYSTTFGWLMSVSNKKLTRSLLIKWGWGYGV
jgi:hypothetical protein